MAVKRSPCSTAEKKHGKTVTKRHVKNTTFKVPYVRWTGAVEEIRMDRVSWKRKLADLLQATDLQVVKLLREDGLLHGWAGKTCPRCEQGKLSKLLSMSGQGMPKHRCNHFRCQQYINPHHLHPIFVDGTGSSCMPLQAQSALLFLLLNGISHAAIHRILHLNHKVIEDMSNRLVYLRKAWVEQKEKNIVFGNGKDWIDVEADEATFQHTDLKDLAKDPNQPVIWEQWCGIVQRGAPNTLLLKRLTPNTSFRRAPGPGAIRKVEWYPLATKHLQDRSVVLRADAAKSYKLKMSGVLHDHVRHCKKCMKVKGRWIWKMPSYVRVTTHKDPHTGRKFKTKGGTQIIDRAWRFLKDRITINQHCKVGSPLLRAKECPIRVLLQDPGLVACLGHSGCLAHGSVILALVEKMFKFVLPCQNWSDHLLPFIPSASGKKHSLCPALCLAQCVMS